MLHDPNFAGQGVPSPIRLRALSLGAGVQSTTMALMAAHGEIGPMPDCAIFADTGWGAKSRLRASRMADVAECPAVPGPYCIGRQCSRQSHGRRSR